MLRRVGADRGGSVGAIDHYVVARLCERHAVRVIVFGDTHVDQELLILHREVTGPVQLPVNPFRGNSGFAERDPVFRDPVAPVRW